jgi:hypothetical protein
MYDLLLSLKHPPSHLNHQARKHVFFWSQTGSIIYGDVLDSSQLLSDVGHCTKGKQDSVLTILQGTQLLNIRSHDNRILTMPYVRSI